MLKEKTVQELKLMMDSGEDYQLIDVRESYEYEICNLKGELIPMGEVLSNLSRISRNKPVIIQCRSGARSGRICQLLEAEYGYTNLFNLKGGILAWADEIDTNLSKY
mgnify:CR=1 FL=1